MTRPCLDCASDSSRQLFRVQLAYSADAIWFEAVCAFWERKRERARWFTHAVCEIMSHIRFSNYFISYLMKIYELYLTYSIIIISPAPDRDWDGALHVVPNLSQQARHQLEIDFLRSAFRDHRSNTPKRLSADNDRYPINRSTPTTWHCLQAVILASLCWWNTEWAITWDRIQISASILFLLP